MLKMSSSNSSGLQGKRHIQVSSSNRGVYCRNTLGTTRELDLSQNRCCNRSPPQKELGDHNISRDASKQKFLALYVLLTVWLLYDYRTPYPPQSASCCPSSKYLLLHTSGCPWLSLMMPKFTSKQLFSFCFIANWQIPLSFFISVPEMETSNWSSLSPSTRTCSDLLESLWCCYPGIRCPYLV